jgi:hypothetical protein
MTRKEPDLITEIDAFLAETRIGPSYFGKKACGNSELVDRLRDGKPILTSTERKVRDFMKLERARRLEA